MKSPAEHSWFNRIRDLLRRYGLPSPSVLLELPLSEAKWKSMVDEAISSSVEETLREDIQSKSSLKYINHNKVKVGQSHPVWSTVRDSAYDSRRAQMCLQAHILSRATGQSLINMLWTRHLNCVAVPQKLVTFWLNVKLLVNKGESTLVKLVWWLTDSTLTCHALTLWYVSSWTRQHSRKVSPRLLNLNFI